MTCPAPDLWGRAIEALHAAEFIRTVSPDASASRAYYAAFYAASALLALDGQRFTKHAAVEAAVHRDLVHSGRRSPDLGRAYTRLRELRQLADYAFGLRASEQSAREAIEAARRILAAVCAACPDDFALPDAQA